MSNRSTVMRLEKSKMALIVATTESKWSGSGSTQEETEWGLARARTTHHCAQHREIPVVHYRRVELSTVRANVRYSTYHFHTTSGAPEVVACLCVRRILYCMPGTARKHINTIVTGREELRFATVVAEDHPFLVDAKDDFENVCISPLARFRNYTENKTVKGRHLLSPLLGRFFTFLFVFLHTVRASWKSWPTPSRTTFV